MKRMVYSEAINMYPVDTGTILFSSNTGGKWEDQSISFKNDLSDISFPGPLSFSGVHSGWALGQNGTILHIGN